MVNGSVIWPQFATALVFAAVDQPILSGVPKPPKVVPIDEQQYKVDARDEIAHRVIANIGGQRYALDFSTRISRLPPATEHRRKRVLRMKRSQPARSTATE